VYGTASFVVATQAIEITPGTGVRWRAGDGNRTRMTSLEVASWLAVTAAELGVRLLASGRD
jgi:hypothetical protein